MFGHLQQIWPQQNSKFIVTKKIKTKRETKLVFKNLTSLGDRYQCNSPNLLLWSCQKKIRPPEIEIYFLSVGGRFSQV